MIETGRYSELLPNPTIDIIEVNRVSRALLGGTLSMHFELYHRGPLEIQNEDFTPNLRLRSVVEENWKGKGAKEKTVLQLEWAGVETGQGSLDSWYIHTSKTKTRLPTFDFEVLPFDVKNPLQDGADLILPSHLTKGKATPSFTRLPSGALLLIALQYSTSAHLR